MAQHTYGQQFAALLEEFQAAARLQPGQLLVIGCSTSEVIGRRIGSASSPEVAGQLFPALAAFAQTHGLHVAVQCCEHLNRSLVVETACMQHYGLEQVHVVPWAKAGGALPQATFEQMQAPVVVESLLGRAHGGIDIGDTFIGMHLRRVAVPVRLASPLGEAHITAARTRPMLVGGERARY